MRITKCPICKEMIQGTRKQYLLDVEINERGFVRDYTDAEEYDMEILELYCTNEHSGDDMTKKIDDVLARWEERKRRRAA